MDPFENVEPPPPFLQPNLQDGQESHDWHTSHKLPQTPSTAPVRGFGPRGTFTLYLARAEATIRILIVNGKPVREVVPEAMNSPEMAKLRIDTILSLKSDDGKIRFDLALVEYACAIIRMCYAATDEELTFLLSGLHWHDPVVRHCLGGDEQIAALLSQKLSPPEPRIVYIHSPQTAPKKRRWFPWKI